MYSVVVPCYKSSRTIAKLVELTTEEFKKIGVHVFEFVLVNDCSPDESATISVLIELAQKYDNVKAIDLAKNTGQHNAVLAGLNYAEGDYIIAMDDDMQTHPSQMHFLIEEIEKGYDIVYGYYPEKKHSGFRNFGSWINYQTVRALIGKPKELKTSSYWIIRKFVRDYVVQYEGSYSYLQGLFLRVTRNISSVPIKHFEREVGTSNYSMKKLIKLWSNIMGFSIVPLRLAIVVGSAFSIFGFLYAVIAVVRKIINPSMVSGWTTIVALLCFFSGLILVFLGVCGEYIGRMYLGVNKEPQYVVRKVYKKED